MFLATNHQRKYLKAKLLPQVLENNVFRLSMVNRNPLYVLVKEINLASPAHLRVTANRIEPSRIEATV